jgi:hypothetical protein
MIIVMKKQANIVMVEYAIRVLQRGGFDVLVKDNGQATIAAIGPGNVSPVAMSNIAGIERIHEQNDLFVSVNGEGFAEAYEFLKKWD